MAGSSGNTFDSFYDEVKAIEHRDSVLTCKQQLDRLLRPGSTYFNLNPFEVLQIDPETKPEDAKKQYKKLSVLIHPDKNLEDRDRADKAFDIVKKAIALIDDPDELDKCRQVVAEAEARTELMLMEKRKKLKRDGKPTTIEEDDPAKRKRSVWMLTCKLFADRERKRKQLEDRANEEKKRKAEEDIEVAETKKMEEAWAQGYEETREERVTSWNKFRKKDKRKKMRGSFKPPKTKMEEKH